MEIAQAVLAIAFVLALLVTFLAVGKRLSPSVANHRVLGRWFSSAPRREKAAVSATQGFHAARASGDSTSRKRRMADSTWLSSLSRIVRPKCATEQNETGLALVAQAPLTSTHRLHLIRNGARQLLVVTHPYGCQQLFLDDGLAARTPTEECHAD